MANLTPKPSSAPGAIPEWLELVRAKVEGLSYGVVQIVVHDSKVTQIERTDKIRLDSPGGDSRRRD